MNFLIDTHILLWSLFDPKKLTLKERHTLLDLDNTIYVSAASLWEISLKFSLGKLQLTKIKPDNIPSLIEKSGFNILPLTQKETSSFYKLPLTNHKDPFDRMLIWQTIQNDMTLITRDKNCSEYKQLGLNIL